MHRRHKATSKAKVNSKSLAGQGKNVIPAQPMKHRDKKKEKKAAVKDSSTANLKNEKAVADSLAKLQLEEKNTKIPKCLSGVPIIQPRIVSTLPSSCAICTKFGHKHQQCPWRRCLPYGITQVGKGFGVDGRRAFRLSCVFCDEIGHEVDDCPKRNKQIRETGSGERKGFKELLDRMCRPAPTLPPL